MATGLYIGSTSSYAGKNMLAVGIGLRLQKEGLRVGYMKPVGTLPVEHNGIVSDEDAFFMQEVLGLDNPPASVCPVLVSQDFRVQVFSGSFQDQMPAIKAAYKELAATCDILLVAGTGSLAAGRYCNLDGLRVVRELGLKALVLDRYQQREAGHDTLMLVRDALGDHMIGAVLNDVPKSMLPEIEQLITPCLERNQTSVFGVIPRDPLLSAITVGDLAESLNGRLISASGMRDRIVENFIIATMQVENFLTRFRNHQNSAIIVGGDRADIQLLAIEGGCPCIVLTGNLYPSDIILTRSEIHSVPIIVVRDDTYNVAKKMESTLRQHKLRDAVKIRQATQLAETAIDFQRLREAIGV